MGSVLLALLAGQCTGASAQVSRLTAGPSFGSSVDMENNLLVVGAPSEDLGAGAVYVYVHHPASGWQQEARLASADRKLGDAFGADVDLSGHYLLVGAPGGGDEGGLDAGAAYVFRRSPLWQQEARLTDPGASLESRFGHAVALHGIHALVGAPFDGDRGADAGAVQTFTFGGGVTWHYRQQLTADRAAAGDQFGLAVSLDAEHAVVGAPGANEARGSDAGLAFVYQRSAGSDWNLQAVLTAGNASASSHFGAAVVVLRYQSLTQLIVGAPNAGGGTAYLFSPVDELWTESFRYRAAESGAGTAVALYETTALVGAPGIERALILSTEEQAGFRPAGELEAPAQQTGACYGCALGLTEDYFAIGAPATDNAVRGQGTVYLFDRSATEMSVPLRVETGGATLTNYPNPFRTSTTISVSPKTNGHLRLEIFDVAGRSVALLLDSPVQRGTRSIGWMPVGLPGGVYFAVAMGAGRTSVHPLALVH